MFGRKKFPAIYAPQVVALLQRANTLEYGAVLELYSIYGSAAPAGPQLWTWWLDQAELAAKDSQSVAARLATEFARNANVAPWGELGPDDYQRMLIIDSISNG